jgi:hypothetical protein
MELSEDIKRILTEKLFLEQFLNEKEIEKFYAMIEHYLLNRSTTETFLKNIDATIQFFELVGVDYRGMLTSMMNWPAIIHANKDELLIKFMLLADVVSFRTGELARYNILINHPKDLMTGIETIYARLCYLQSEQGKIMLRNEGITRRKVLKVTHSEFEEIYRIKKEDLLERYPFTPDALEDIMHWESNREFVEKYEEKTRIRKN